MTERRKTSPDVKKDLRDLNDFKKLSPITKKEYIGDKRTRDLNHL